MCTCAARPGARLISLHAVIRRPADPSRAAGNAAVCGKSAKAVKLGWICGRSSPNRQRAGSWELACAGAGGLGLCRYRSGGTPAPGL